MTSAGRGMVDAGAKAIYEQRNGFGAQPWSRLPRSHQEPYRLDMRAALTAMRTPTPGMLEAVAPYPAHLVRERNDLDYERGMRAATIADQMTFRSQWRNAIDAALAEDGGGA